MSDAAGNESPTCLNGSTIAQKRFPAEWENHTRTFMVWPASAEIFWGDLLDGVRRDIAGIAKAISKYEQVVVLAKPDQVEDAQKELGSDISVIPMEVDDLWARDTLPVFVENSKLGVYGIDFHFNGWGGKQEHAKDGQVARKLLDHYKLSCVDAGLVGEGGAFETDGLGTLLATESSLVNDNRNPGRSRDDVEKELKEALGVTKVIWIKGVKGLDITDAHVDALARFASPGVVVLSRPANGTNFTDVWAQSSNQAKEVLKDATDARRTRIRVVELQDPNPDKITGTGKEFLSSYVNYYVANGVVVMPKFGDEEADKRAQETLKELYPGRDIVALNIDSLAAGGGGIHCSTHEQPAHAIVVV